MQNMQGDTKSMQLQRLSPKQRQVFDFICAEHAEKGEYPSIGIMANKFGVTRGAIYQHLKFIMKKKYVEPNETGKYVPTGAGISQRITDFTRPGRVTKPRPNPPWYDAKHTKSSTQGVPYKGKLWDI